MAPKAASRLRAAIFVVAALLFVALLVAVRRDGVTGLDAWAYQLVVVRMRQGWFTPLMESVSQLAFVPVLLVMVLTIAVLAPGRRAWLCAAVNLGAEALLNVALKHLVQRPRPDEALRLVTEAGYSFPSGHAMAAMAFYGLLIWLVWRYARSRPLRWLGAIGYGLVILLVGLSRVYLGVHYATDVLAGYCASLAWLLAYTRFLAPRILHEDADGPHATPAAGE